VAGERTRDLRARSNVVQVDWLARHLDDPSVVVVDCRFDLANPDGGRAAYAEAHIPGAAYLDLERDLSGPKGQHGGRHPLPAVDQFSRTLGALGIDEAVTVVAYDVPQTGIAPRLWWMLRYLGHDRVHVLNGGWPAWRAARLPVNRDVGPKRAARKFVARPRPDFTVTVQEVRRIAPEGGARLVDSRAAERYRGEVEPLDPVAGHIPGAVNLPWNETLDEAGRLKPRAALAERFAGFRGGEVVVYCGSGVTACANLLAMEEAGLHGARLYPGSWSDWCSYPDNPVATGGTTKAGRPNDTGRRPSAGREEEQRG
jgi:thiosulfate/3-mercaptopyruvate sulfurtransferase